MANEFQVAAHNYLPVLKQMGMELYTSAGTPTANGPAKGALVVDTTNGKLYINAGTAASATWNSVGDISASEITMSDGSSINDSNGNELIKAAVTGSAVNEITVTNAITTAAPSISATGGDTNIGLTLKGKGTGAVTLGQATSVGVVLAADQPLLDSSSNELVKFGKTASAVNEVTITNAATNTGPIISATGGDSNVPLLLQAKGTSNIITNAAVVGATGSVLSANTAGDTTLTAAQVLAGIAVIDPNGAGRNLIFPTATNLVAAIPGCVVGQTVRLHVVNGADAAENITLVADASGGFDTNQTAASRIIGQNASKDVLVRITNVGTPAYVIYA